MHPVSGSSRSLLLLAEEAKQMEQRTTTAHQEDTKPKGQHTPTTQASGQ